MEEQIKTAKALYANSGDETKKALEAIFGADAFSSEWNELFLAVCKEEGLTITHDAKTARETPNHVYIPFSNPVDKEEERDNASRMIRAIIACNNKRLKWEADYDNGSQEKWFPIFEKLVAGFVFSHASCESWDSCTRAIVGSPFVSPSSKEAERLAKKYLPIYIKYIQ